MRNRGFTLSVTAVASKTGVVVVVVVVVVVAVVVVQDDFE